MSDDDLEIDAPAPPSDEALTAQARERREALEAGILEVRRLVDAEREKFAALCRVRQKLDAEPPEADLPRAESDGWVTWAAARLTEGDSEVPVPHWFTDEDLCAIGEDFLSRPMRDLRALPEFKVLAPVVIAIRWTRKPVLRRDYLGTVDYHETRCGRPKVVQEVERLTWSGPGAAPMFRLELSLPWFLLAEDHEINRGLHELLACLGLRNGKPMLRKPDVAAFATTLARFGVGHIREAGAIAHAQAHPQHRALMQSFGVDPTTGQGMLFGEARTYEAAQRKLRREDERDARPKVPRQEAQTPRQGKDAAAEPREPELYTADPEEGLN